MRYHEKSDVSQALELMRARKPTKAVQAQVERDAYDQHRFHVGWNMIRFQDRDAERAVSDLRIKWQIKRCTLPNGRMWVYNWSRDCDLYEADRILQIPATREAYEELYSECEDCAEGPWSLYPITKAEADAFEPSWRDRAAEQMGY